MAIRETVLTLRVSKQELATIDALAQSEKLPTGTFVRQQLLLEAERRGIVPLAEKEEGTRLENESIIAVAE